MPLLYQIYNNKSKYRYTYNTYNPDVYIPMFCSEVSCVAIMTEVVIFSSVTL